MANQTAHEPQSNEVPIDSSSIVLIADTFQSTGIRRLEEIGCRVESDASLQGEILECAIREIQPDILVVRSTKVTKEMMDASKKLCIIIRAGAGYDTIDTKAASSRGISVANCPGKNSIAVAELAWGLILACDRRIPDQVIDLRANRWNKKEFSNSSGLYGRTIGVVGLGGIGSEVVKRAKSFGMHVVAWSRSLTTVQAKEMDIEMCSDLHELASKSDVVSVHVASTPDTKHLIDKDFLSNMKETAIFVNTSRGAVVDESALVNAVDSKHLRVGLDVFEHEPSAGDQQFNSEVTTMKHVYGTHHVGASTTQAQEAIASEAVRIIESYVQDGVVLHCVNRASDTSATALLSIRHKNLPGVLANVFDELSVAGINVEEMENILYKGEEAACARIQLGTVPSAKLMATISEGENIISAMLTTKE